MQEPPSRGRGTDPDEFSSHDWDESDGRGESDGWELWIGPGTRLDRLAAVLEALGPLSEGAPSDQARLDDLEELALLEAPERGRLVLDADAVPSEDLGYVRRFLERTPGFELALIGDAPGRGALRRLPARSALGSAVRWIAWPPDLSELEELCEPPHAAAPSERATPLADDVHAAGVRPTALQRERDLERALRDTPPAPETRPEALPAESRIAPDPEPARATAPAQHRRGLGADEARELAAIQAVLDLPPMPGHLDLDPDPIAPVFGASEQDPFGGALADAPAPALEPALEDELEDEPAPGVSELDPFARPHARQHAQRGEAAAPTAARTAAPGTTPGTTPGTAPATPGYYRAQIADLADIAQRVDLALRALRPEPDRAAPPDDGYEPLAAEVARLLQFTRTLSYLVAPPPRGSQTFDLGVLVEEVLDQTVELGPEAPRCVFRRADGLVVRSDKGLLVQALDAFVVLALTCAGPGELIRVQVRAVDAGRGAGGGAARLSLEFPSGALADLAPEHVVEPYALKARLPSYGPNALSAASGIVAGQGGAVRLGQTGDGRLELTVELPLA